jgi:hypothetical protein
MELVKFAVLFAIVSPLVAQQPSIPAGARYWVPAGSFVGASVCAGCHEKEAEEYRANSMFNALESVAACRTLQGAIHYTFQEGPYRYAIEREGANVVYKVTRGTDTFSVPLEFAFGQGKAGQTYVYSLEGKFYESRVSYYSAIKNLDLTVGSINTQPTDLRSAAGRLMQGNEPRDCFGCHTTGARTGATLQFEKYEPGIQCESCHGAGAGHIDAVRAGDRSASIRSLKGMTPSESNEFCGACHRTYETVRAMAIKGINTARFPSYRIAGSPCFSFNDARISGTACHDPHAPLVSDDKYYDSKCLACHGEAGAKHCSVGKEACTSCHMQRVSPPEAHHAFPDHWFRIVRSPAYYPE